MQAGFCPQVGVDTIAGARAAVSALEMLQSAGLGVRSLQEFFPAYRR